MPPRAQEVRRSQLGPVGRSAEASGSVRAAGGSLAGAHAAADGRHAGGAHSCDHTRQLAAVALGCRCSTAVRNRRHLLGAPSTHAAAAGVAATSASCHTPIFAPMSPAAALCLIQAPSRSCRVLQLLRQRRLPRLHIYRGPCQCHHIVGLCRHSVQHAQWPCNARRAGAAHASPPR